MPQGAKAWRHCRLHQVNQAADKVERSFAKGEFQAQGRAEQVGHHGKARVVDPSEEQCRTATGDHTAMDLRDFKGWINGRVDGEQLVVGSQHFQKLTQIDTWLHAVFTKQ